MHSDLRDPKQNCEHSPKIANKLSENCKQTSYEQTGVSEKRAKRCRGKERKRGGLGSCRPGKLPKSEKFPKVVRRGCKRSFGPRVQEASCTGAKWSCSGAKEGLGGAKDSWETFAPWAQKSQKDLVHPPLTTFGDFPFLGNFPGPQHAKGWPAKRAKTKKGRAKTGQRLRARFVDLSLPIEP